MEYGLGRPMYETTCKFENKLPPILSLLYYRNGEKYMYFRGDWVYLAITMFVWPIHYYLCILFFSFFFFFNQFIVVVLDKLLQSSQWARSTSALGIKLLVAFASSKIQSFFIQTPAWYSERDGQKLLGILQRYFLTCRALLFRLKSINPVVTTIITHLTVIRDMDEAKEGEEKESIKLL